MDNPFLGLIDEQLSSVIFVQDYLQLDFDGQRITCYNWPIVILSKRGFVINDQDYRNALCSLIAKKVTSISFIEEEALVMSFPTDDEIIINLKDAEGEVIYFTTPDGEWSSI